MAASSLIEADSIVYSKLNALKASLGAACAGIKFHVRTLNLDSALTDADTSQAVSIQADDAGNNFPANARPISAHTLVKRAIGGASISALTVQIGDAADPDEMLTATDLFGDALNSWTDAPGVATAWRLESGYVPTAQYDSTGANVSAVTGEVIHVITYYKMPSPFVDGAPSGLVLAAA